MGDIFLSYAREDRAAAVKVAEALERHGWSTWWDAEIPAGRSWDEVIESRLAQACCVVVLWSHVSVDKRWVRTEAAEGLERQMLVPALLDDTLPPLEFRRIQAASLIDWDGDENHLGFRQLLAAIKANAGQKISEQPKKLSLSPEEVGERLPVPTKSASRRRRLVWLGATGATLAGLFAAGMWIGNAPTFCASGMMWSWSSLGCFLRCEGFSSYQGEGGPPCAVGFGAAVEQVLTPGAGAGGPGAMSEHPRELDDPDPCKIAGERHDFQDWPPARGQHFDIPFHPPLTIVPSSLGPIGGLKCTSVDICLQLIATSVETQALDDRLSALARLANRFDQELIGHDAPQVYRQQFTCFATNQILKTISAGAAAAVELGGDGADRGRTEKYGVRDNYDDEARREELGVGGLRLER